MDSQLPVSPTTTLVSPPSTLNKPDLNEGLQDTPAPQSRLSDPYPGAFTDFYGLPSNPRCVFKPGNGWRVRTCPEAHRILQEARPVCDHPMQGHWLEIGQLIYEHLDSCDVKWSSIDPVRLAEAGEEEATILHLWIGVIPGTLASEAAKEAAKGCKDILAQEGFPDVEVAFRKSVVTQSVGPTPLPFNASVNRVPELRSPFTPTLGISIALLKTPHFEGTGALYLRESSQNDRVFLFTAGHVARPPPIYHNQPLPHRHGSQAHEEIVVLGTGAYTEAINRMISTIEDESFFIEIRNDEIEGLGPFVEGEASRTTLARKERDNLVERAKRKTEDVHEIHGEVTRQGWTTPNQRVIGHVVHTPAIIVDDGPEHFTQDWALVELYRNKIDWKTFQGNKIYIGTFSSYLGNTVPGFSVFLYPGGKISRADFRRKMHPHPESRSGFKYPLGGLLQVKGVVKDDEIRKP